MSDPSPTERNTPTPPHCAGRAPIVLELEPGTYWWCQCGLSNTQPFCDGSHAGTPFEPVELVITERKKYGLCTCKTSSKGPICDGSHKRLPPE
ncbi:MAG TPA: CDGSH iron-sulfur domain-containing protein [Phycisphaerae bacterium]|nr:CDGSH iron-sulfur domain-containing protein [Phycisphaerae bacterium]